MRAAAQRKGKRVLIESGRPSRIPVIAGPREDADASELYVPPGLQDEKTLAWLARLAWLAIRQSPVEAAPRKGKLWSALSGVTSGVA